MGLGRVGARKQKPGDEGNMEKSLGPTASALPMSKRAQVAYAQMRSPLCGRFREASKGHQWRAFYLTRGVRRANPCSTCQVMFAFDAGLPADTEPATSLGGNWSSWNCAQCAEAAVFSHLVLNSLHADGIAMRRVLYPTELMLEVAARFVWQQDWVKVLLKVTPKQKRRVCMKAVVYGPTTILFTAAVALRTFGVHALHLLPSCYANGG